MDHKKPTKEELQEQIDKSLEDVDKLKDTPEPDPEPEPKPSEPAPEPEPEPEPKPEPQPDVDYKKKFVESTREAQVLHAKNKKINEVIETALTLPDPTDEELKKEFTDWDVMTDTEKKLATDNLKSTRRFAMLEEVTRESKDIETWNTKVDSFVDDPKTLVDNPELEGKLDDFKLFATKPTRRGVDFGDLVLAFGGEEAKKTKPKNKGSMFETGTGGPNDRPKPKSDKISIEQARVLRETDYKKYTEYLKAGKIENDL
jgi:hypothetical protein